MELLSGLQHVRNSDLHLKLIDLNPNRGIIILFIFTFDCKSSKKQEHNFSDLC